MTGDTISISAKAFYNMDKTLPGQGVDIVPVLGSAIAAISNPTGAVVGEAAQLAADLGTTASQSVALTQVPKKDDQNNDVKPESDINFVLYNDAFEVIPENTGVLLVEDKINEIQTLATDKMVMQEAGFIEVFIDNQAQTPVFFDNLILTATTGPVMEVNAYYPFGMIIPDLSTIAGGDRYNAYKYSAKELETALNLGYYNFGNRMLDPAIARFMVPDRFAEKYYHLSPYSYAANNPINFIDINGDSISVADLYARNEQGEFINPNQVKAFDFLASTKEGRALLANYAAKGQTIAGVTFNKDGAFHKNGINLSFDAKTSKPHSSGETGHTLDENNLNIRIGVRNSSDIADLVDTYTHEIAIHADQYSADFTDDKVLNNSNVYPALRQMDQSTNYKQHWQERNVNRAMERVGVPIMQQYYKSQGIVKSNDAILKMVYGFLNN